MLRPKPRQRQSIVWRPFAEGGRSIPFYESKNFMRMIMLAIILALYFLVRSWWLPIPVKSLKQREFFDSHGVRRIKALDSSREHVFMSSILKKPAPLPKSGVKVMDSFVASKLVAAESSRYRSIGELDFCDILNGAIVDTFTSLNLPPISSKNVNESLKKRIASLVDETAKKTYHDIFDYYADVDPLEAKRYACYTALEGSNPNTNLSDTQFLVKIDATQYFSQHLPSMKSSPSVIPGKRRKYKIAYLLMIQELHGIHQFKLLMEMLNDSNAIFLVHVQKNDENMYNTVKDYIKQLPVVEGEKFGHVFLSKTRYGSAGGHINQLFTELSGFWELLDLADWDYVINLSNYDWPLRLNPEIHELLMRKPGFSYLDMNLDTSSSMARRLRPHLGDKTGKNNVHPPELGIGRWPFSHWQLLDSSQYMILTRQAVEFLRNDDFSFNVLAFLEHCRQPENIFFITVLGNSPSQQQWIVQEKKRYSRDISLGWLGWKDKNLFPPGSSDPSYLFLRPFNALGDFFEEAKLKEFVQNMHLRPFHARSCAKKEFGANDDCIQEIASGFAKDGELIIIPVLKEFYELSANLRCSLNRLGIDNIMHWSFDRDIHSKLIGQNLLSYYDPSTPKTVLSDLYLADALKSAFVRNRAQLILKLLKAGFNLWFLDPDTVATRDFRDRAKKYTTEPFNADIIFSLAESKLVKPTGDHILTAPPDYDIGVMYIKNSDQSILFFGSVVSALAADPSLNGKEAMRQVLEAGQVHWTGVGSKSVTLEYGDQLLASQSQGTTGQSQEKSKFVNGLVDFFNFYATQSESKKLRVHYFDQFEFVNGRIIFKAPELVPEEFKGYRLIHADVEKNVKESFSTYDLWYLDHHDLCKSR